MCSDVWVPSCNSTTFSSLPQPCRCMHSTIFGPHAACDLQPAAMLPAALQSATPLAVCNLQHWILLPAALKLPLPALCAHPIPLPLQPEDCSLATCKQPCSPQSAACSLGSRYEQPGSCRVLPCACPRLTPRSLQPAVCSHAACSLAVCNLLPAALDPAACSLAPSSLARGRRHLPEAFGFTW